MNDDITLTINPFNRVIHPQKGANLLDAFLEEGVEIPVLCNRNGSCGKCRVVVRAEANPPGDIERFSLGELLINEGYRLACRTEIRGSGEVLIPLEHHEDLLESAYVGNELSAIKAEGFPHLPGKEPGRRRLPSGSMVALDIGTTTFSGYLFDHEGKLLSHASLFNPTALYGADVITRLTRIQRSDNDFRKMRRSLLSGVKRILTVLCLRVSGPEGGGREEGIEHIGRMAICGNTIMQHIFLGINPVEIGLFPYRPIVKDFLLMPMRALDDYGATGLNKDGELLVAPSATGFIGGDAVCGIIAARLHLAQEPCLLIDLGTNGEIVLSCAGGLFAASASAGPAFEGYRISSGMRASVGAIDAVAIGDTLDVTYTVIGNGKPRGICGTGVVAAVAALLKARALTSKGHIRPRRPTNRIRENTFIIAAKDETSTGNPIVITDKDIGVLQQAKAAFAAGISCLLLAAGLEEKGLKKIFIAGAFGSRIDVDTLRTIGLIPSTIDCEVVALGNAAGIGVAQLLLSEDAERDAVETARKIKTIELSSHKDFEEHYMNALFFKTHDDQ